MTVEEVKGLIPESEVYTLTMEARYLIVAKRNTASPDMANELIKRLGDMGITALVMLSDDTPTLLQMKE